MLLFTRSCEYHHKWSNVIALDIKEQAVSKKDLMPSENISLKDINYPIVFHYKESQKFDNVYSMNHIISLNWKALDSCPPMPDSSNAIHVYIRNNIKMSKNIFLGLYFKTSMNEETEYKLTYPVNDDHGFHIATDSGTVTSVMHWKSYGMNTQNKFKDQAKEKMTKIVEENLLKDIAKKMELNEDSN